ncbi:hypothetical protein [Riemerella anatipestifer]|uniref:hypothetical protein n=1 Tax=Riemerella anatipestifer TaxID=34085 RepID=UPI0016224FD2|nr:hypothetical protein [Riemerella anatipestifer]
MTSLIVLEIKELKSSSISTKEAIKLTVSSDKSFSIRDVCFLENLANVVPTSLPIGSVIEFASIFHEENKVIRLIKELNTFSFQ